MSQPECEMQQKKTSIGIEFMRASKAHAAEDWPKFNRHALNFREMAQSAVETAEHPDDALAALLYKGGEHDALLTLFERFKGAFTSDMLPILAASVYLSRNTPRKVSEACACIQDPEARILRLKTAVMMADINAPLREEPRVHLIILTYNREKHVTRALEELARTDYTNYAVYIADNGSQDGTLERVREAAKKFPPHVPVKIVPFPVNIGRPAGHNWLLSDPEHKHAEYIAIGDDDLVRVPPDWLRRMVQTARQFPGCGCVGGKGLTPGWPRTVHAGVRNFVEFGPQRVVLSNNGDVDDLGQFDFIDVVDHVIGCLHIFDRAVLERVGFFDIRFSPCQFVDIEHHLRMLLAGCVTVYNGCISFEHMRAMGVEASKNKALLGNSIGNSTKLLYKYDQEEARQGIVAYHKRRDNWLLGDEM